MPSKKPIISRLASYEPRSSGLSKRPMKPLALRRQQSLPRRRFSRRRNRRDNVFQPEVVVHQRLDKRLDAPPVAQRVVEEEYITIVICYVNQMFAAARVPQPGQLTRPARTFSPPPSLVEPDARISVFFSLRLTVSYMSWNVATFVHLGLRFRFYSGAGRLARCLQDVSAMLFLPLYKTPRLP